MQPTCRNGDIVWTTVLMKKLYIEFIYLNKATMPMLAGKIRIADMKPV